MDSGSEHYFDSVEEIYDFAESSPSMKLLPKNDNDEITEDDIIPYYDKATCKTEINLDKLELLKKRQQYGMKASRINRIKIIEKKALKDLEKEINESKIGCK
ncbi:unnamed protein product [Acanthoscelides obtectus]|uniref:Uncharacterized protein n=1 Tax=Acanthoscelides obtectus TaxID=200917 RepID=A0A9P0KV55_ACAOB|nr:unnamed protein product [Acanthoscelides obtectus]CAK1676324.1 hypothetical protein AOBTE_LOCUS30693 [Acanthoscelides obtectus]